MCLAGAQSFASAASGRLAHRGRRHACCCCCSCSCSLLLCPARTGTGASGPTSAVEVLLLRWPCTRARTLLFPKRICLPALARRSSGQSLRCLHGCACRGGTPPGRPQTHSRDGRGTASCRCSGVQLSSLHPCPCRCCSCSRPRVLFWPLVLLALASSVCSQTCPGGYYPVWWLALQAPPRSPSVSAASLSVHSARRGPALGAAQRSTC
mmetsp:Transcript_33119/g.71051  ORF Transcript_33119/g.71051 Transcript_33119/m.71051 type:complete len:209 (-) Transcript_33119:182-808(-)